MARRPNTQAPARATCPPTVARTLAPVLAVAAALALSACSVTFNPGPGEAAFEANRWQLGEASEPVRNTTASAVGTEPGPASASGTRSAPGTDVDPGTEHPSTDGDGASVVDAVETGTIEVQPAPEKSPDDDADQSDDESPDEDGPAGGGAAGDDDGAGADTGDDGSGAGDDGGTVVEPGLSASERYARALEAEVNQRREGHGVTALAHDDCAYAEALERAEALRGQDLAHAPLEPIFDRCPTSTVGENLARGGWSPAEAADGWMNSEGHRANILNAGFTRGAIACISEDTSYGPQMTCAHVFLG
ncbi:CAP domain-containing protein [Myceligenerans pegani]|uniref:CAP domain-containing protein n=1 Tax=Myceligenerans pegani TaxID=2776917 RepID=A0ABR9MV30_9MICO|nr:CAP domain-containing protein [Myceligenerans sp. TRM 65318]MBE1875235.1 CAP domain-containing protein [Myceligenerans sp. TRM 65318]MBE3017506.1 CAP domain-containing protein [Myceligenerans sp. TRM 65318]